MQKAEYSPWSGNNFPCNKQNMLAVNVSEKEADLPEGDLKPNVDGYVECGKRPSLVAKVLNVITRLWDFAGQSDSTFSSQTPDTIEKEDPCERKTISVTATMPIFETKKDGTGRLTVPLDYDSTADDVAMTPAGVYVEDVPTCGRTTTRPVGLRKRRKQSAKGNQQTAAAGESVKVGGKNRKDKKRSHLRNDIYDDSLALSMDEWYDYRNDEYGDPIGSGCYLSTSFSPSSIESVNSFHDALQDLGALVLGACMQGSFGSAGGPSSSSVDVTPSPHLSARRSSTTQPAPSVDERVQPKCDISSDRSDFVVVTDREVFTTPSASPARRRPPRGLCTAFTYYFNKPPSTDRLRNEEDEEDDEEDDSDNVTEDEFDDSRGCGVEVDFDDDDDDDDDSVVFCADPDDFDDSNSSSGFEERKVRFCQKPVIHVMRAWDFAYRQARKGEWEMAARDRERFRKRIDDLEPVLGPALQPSVRDKIYAERFSRPEESPPARAMETTDFPT